MCGRRLAEVQGELQLVRYDKDRQTLVHEELLTDHRHLQLEHEKLQKKVSHSWPHTLSSFTSLSLYLYCDHRAGRWSL